MSVRVMEDECEPRRGGTPAYHLQRFWPTDNRVCGWVDDEDEQHPGETVPEWCDRLDDYYNPPGWRNVRPGRVALMTSDAVETFDTAEAAISAWQDGGRQPARIGRVRRWLAS